MIDLMRRPSGVARSGTTFALMDGEPRAWTSAHTEPSFMSFELVRRVSRRPSRQSWQTVRR
jgi:hypothetical protein